jgi:predicted SAM-dependent methyltransferase
MGRAWPELRAIWHLRHRVIGLWALRRLASKRGSPIRLHIGSGDRILPGWINIDLKAYPGVDLVADVTHGLPFTNVSAIFAEHFLEHLELLHAVGFICEAHRVLNPSGKLRLSTPNLDWIWRTHYTSMRSGGSPERAALIANRAFYGWRHRFLWNRELLATTLEACGFTDICWLSYGESNSSDLRGLERHEKYPDEPGYPHILVVEARKDALQEAKLRLLKQQMCEEFVFHLPG